MKPSTPHLDRPFEAASLDGPVLPDTPHPSLLLGPRPTLDPAPVLSQILAEQSRYRSALLLRGPGVDGPAAFTQSTDARFPGDLAHHAGEQSLITSATTPVYESVRFAAGETLLWHHENSFAHVCRPHTGHRRHLVRTAGIATYCGDRS